MKVVPYTPGHLDEMRTVCIAQASERARTSETYGKYTLLMYCDPYVELDEGIVYLLLDDDGVARGYVIGAEDYRSWNPAFEPYRERIAALGPEYAGKADEGLELYASGGDEYPGHLHINIDERFCGGGNGRMLMEALLNRFREDGVAGLKFGVAAANERAVGFYEHMGFHKLDEHAGGAGYTFGMRL